MKPDKQFLKSNKTKSPVATSKREVERILQRYGARAYSCAEDYHTGKVIVQFAVLDSPNSEQMTPVKIPLDIGRIYKLLYGMEPKSRMSERGSDWERAERVAWRNLVLWIDAALSAAAAGLQTIEEAFFAHVVIGSERMIELVHDGNIHKQLGSGR